MYKIKSIGTVKTIEVSTIIQVEQKYQKALKHVDEFSHIHVFYFVSSTGKYTVKRVIVEIQEVNLQKGWIKTSAINDCAQEASLIDIKPYFPSEDTVRQENILKTTNNFKGKIDLSDDNDSIHAELLQDESMNLLTYGVNAIGEIRNVNGKIYIQLEKMVNIMSKYITIFWWFHKFDTEQYRRITECNPPYENAPRTGVFATRSPVRPNPIAMTVACVLEIDEENKRIYLNNIESFDRTPCIGIREYHAEEHCIKESRVPEWLKHWPKAIDETAMNEKSDELQIKDSILTQLLSEQSINNQRDDDPHELKDILQEYRNHRPTEIIVHGARENNLQGINVRIPYGKITAVVGVSGSGKSSLVKETIYAECRRRMEYLSHSHNTYQKPLVDEMSGCIPAVIITQDAVSGNTYSTVGTYTDAYDYLRNIYANIGIRHCPECGNEIIPLSKERILKILGKQQNARIFNLSDELVQEGTLEQKVEKALKDGEGAIYASINHKEKILFQTKQKCYHCNKIMFEQSPATFSYMDPDYRCPMCNGTGKISVIEEEKVIEHPEISLLDGASSFYGKLRNFQNNPNANWMKGQVFGLANSMQVDLEKPWRELPEDFREVLLHGSKQEVTFFYDNKKNGRKGEITRQVEGIYSMIERLMEENSDSNGLKKYTNSKTCTTCQGERLAKEGRMATILGMRYPEAARMTFQETVDFCANLKRRISRTEYEQIASSVNNLLETAQAAMKLGVGYLALNQETRTLSGGEGQRLKLLGAFKNHISGILYVFDEPSKGLHPKDYQKIIDFMRSLVAEGNTIIMVEHNPDMIRIADHVIEIGPGAGEKGGTLVGEGTLEAMLNHCGTQIYKYMNQQSKTMNPVRKALDTKYEFLELNNLNYNNLKNIKVQIPLQALTCICGVSGSGKSSLMKNEIYTSMELDNKFSNVILVDQSQIGKTSKSIVATYIGIMDFIRSEFANTSVAQQKKYDESYFSFNSTFGQCDVCKGEGRIKVKFTEDVSISCPDCHGSRYKKNMLEVTYKGKNISEILNLSVNQAISLWKETDEKVMGLRFLQKVGLGFLKLGQGTATLSGGEASRLKLAKELMTKTNGNTLYLLDEPTTGLHFSDVENLLILIDELIKGGNTVIAIEHNRQFVDHCDWRIELGPGAGREGGNIIFQGKNSNENSTNDKK